MRIIENVRFSEGIHFKKRILRRFINNKIIPGIYVIRLAYEPDQLEIIRADYLKQEPLREEDKPIVAFASNYDSALSMVMDLTNEACEAFGSPDIRAYLNL